MFPIINVHMYVFIHTIVNHYCYYYFILFYFTLFLFYFILFYFIYLLLFTLVCKFKCHRRCVFNVAQNCKWATKSNLEHDQADILPNVSQACYLTLSVILSIIIHVFTASRTVDICLSDFLSIYLSLCLSIYLSTCTCIYLSTYLSI